MDLAKLCGQINKYNSSLNINKESKISNKIICKKKSTPNKLINLHFIKSLTNKIFPNTYKKWNFKLYIVKKVIYKFIQKMLEKLSKYGKSKNKTTKKKKSEEN